MIVQSTASARVAALGDVRQLPSIGSVAGHIPKKSAATAKMATDSLLAGAARVWLDRKVQATALNTTDLDHNLGQISAPKAWDAGYTGKGARVAVLDSGADFTHPDLAGQVADRADFTVEGGDAVDHFGHGTHVAATIAGNGSASHGERRGVAPNARLLIGKVLDDSGSGSDSQIISGMEWAASRADVINMSLGGSDPSDGTDPLSLAVDALTKQTGALFVIAAGNSGGAIASPGSAAAALTVGAVDDADRLADFSSRGPLVNTRAAKPELVAPGVDVVAARAAGTTLGSPVDKYYVFSSGTSMATPHAAGAAALLAQRHPDWKADRLKAALIGAADPLPGADPYAVGAGRLNAVRALLGPVSDQPVTFYVEPQSYDLTVSTVKMPPMSPDASDWVNVLVTNLDDPMVYGGGAFATPGDTVTLRVPVGRYAVTGAYSAYDPETSKQQGTFVGNPDVSVTADSTMKLDPATAKPLTASIGGVATKTTTVDFTYLQTSRGGLTWYDFVSGWGESASISVAPMKRPGIGSLRAYAGYGLESPDNTASPYLYDLAHDFGNAVPADPSYRVTTAERAELARIDQRFNQMDSPGMVTSLRRYGYTTDGLYLTQHRTYDLPATRTDYVSPGFIWQDEGIYGGLLAQEGARGYQPGSRQAKTWARQPLHSDWYDDPAGVGYGCVSAPARTRGNLSVDLVLLTDQHQRADCLAGGSIGVNRKLSLYRDGKLVGEGAASRADFTVPEKAADYRLDFDVETSLILPISTRVSTSWTFRSAGPNDTSSVPLPLLSVDYALPLDAANHPAGGTATFSVRQAKGVPTQRVTSFQVWTSTDGATWRSARVHSDGDGYRADLPATTAGQAVSLRVKAAAGGGSGIEQTIIRAYHAG
ncbi:S8 family serine peptidase [Streptosporangium subroseum]|uniref:S8 family serine peptidase n=1 Tax=Streptosporangium subroseum TaxID=106412 RepID=UPI00344594E4